MQKQFPIELENRLLRLQQITGPQTFMYPQSKQGKAFFISNLTGRQETDGTILPGDLEFYFIELGYITL